MMYLCHFQNIASGKTYTRMIRNPNFRQLRADIVDQFLYADPLK